MRVNRHMSNIPHACASNTRYIVKALHATVVWCLQHCPACSPWLELCWTSSWRLLQSSHLQPVSWPGPSTVCITFPRSQPGLLRSPAHRVSPAPVSITACSLQACLCALHGCYLFSEKMAWLVKTDELFLYGDHWAILFSHLIGQKWRNLQSLLPLSFLREVSLETWEMIQDMSCL